MALQVVRGLERRAAIGARELFGRGVVRYPLLVHLLRVRVQHVSTAEQLITLVTSEALSLVSRQVPDQSGAVLERLGTVLAVVQLGHRIPRHQDGRGRRGR